MKLFKIESKKDKKIANLEKKVKFLNRENNRLRARHDVKDKIFKEVISDGLRHGSPVAARHMNDRKKILHGK